MSDNLPFNAWIVWPVASLLCINSSFHMSYVRYRSEKGSPAKTFGNHFNPNWDKPFKCKTIFCMWARSEFSYLWPYHLRNSFYSSCSLSTLSSSPAQSLLICPDTLLLNKIFYPQREKRREVWDGGGRPAHHTSWGWKREREREEKAASSLNSHLWLRRIYGGFWFDTKLSHRAAHRGGESAGVITWLSSFYID